MRNRKAVEVTDDCILCCPICSSENVHHGDIEVFNRSEDDPECLYTYVGNGKACTRIADNADNPSVRRHGLRIRLWCEMCEDYSALTIEQHKGSTFIRAEDRWRGSRYS